MTELHNQIQTLHKVYRGKKPHIFNLKPTSHTPELDFLFNLDEAYLGSQIIYLYVYHLISNLKLPERNYLHPKCRLSALNYFKVILAYSHMLKRICTLNMHLGIINDLLWKPFQPMRSQTVAKLLCIYNDPSL